jgi:hypothetical protein
MGHTHKIPISLREESRWVRHCVICVSIFLSFKTGSTIATRPDMNVTSLAITPTPYSLIPYNQ